MTRFSGCNTLFMYDNYTVPNKRQAVNTLRTRQNCRHFADDIFKCIFLNENICISIKISLKSVPKIRINNIPALVQIMARRRPGDKPLSESMVASLLTHMCVTPPQWVNIQSTARYSKISWTILNDVAWTRCDSKSPICKVTSKKHMYRCT